MFWLPGCTLGPGVGVGGFLPVTCPNTPGGIVELLGLVHCGILQQTGSVGSATIIQLGDMLLYVGHL